MLATCLFGCDVMAFGGIAAYSYHIYSFAGEVSRKMGRMYVPTLTAIAEPMLCVVGLHDPWLNWLIVFQAVW